MFCKSHGGGRRCVFLGCTKGAAGSTPFCKGHGGGKRCTSQGCTKSVHGGTLFCVNHGGGKRCAVIECSKSARGRSNYCVRHGGGKRCKLEGCTKSAQGMAEEKGARGERWFWGLVGLTVPFHVISLRLLEGNLVSVLSTLRKTQAYERSEMVSTTQDPGSCTSTMMKGTFVYGFGNNHSYPVTSKNCGTTSIGSMGQGNFVIGNYFLEETQCWKQVNPVKKAMDNWS